MRWRSVTAAVCLAGAACTGGGSEEARPGQVVGERTTTTTTAPTSTTAPAAITTTVPPTTAAPPTTAPPVTNPVGPTPVPAPCDVPAGYPEPWADRPRYTGRLTVPATAGEMLTGELSVRFTPDAATDRLVFRLWPNAPRPGRAGGRLEITSADIGGVPTPGTYEPGGAAAGKPGTIFALPGSFPAGRAVTVNLGFRLVVPGPINDRVARIGRNYRLGSVLPVLSWIRGAGWQTTPAVDAFAEGAASEVADWDIRVEAPPGTATLATGDEVEPGRFVARAVRDWAATVGPMRIGLAPAQGGATEVVVGVTAGAGGDPNALARRVAATLDDLASRYGSYPYARLTIGVTTNLTGGIEFPTHIHIGSGTGYFHLVHEIAHQWFYGLAGNDQYRHPWIDEALATYAESRLGGRLAYQRGRAMPAAGRNRIGEPMSYWARYPGAYHKTVYVGGAQALAAYGDRIGGYAALDCALRHYVSDRAYSVSGPAEVFDALNRHTGVDPGPVLETFGIRK